jgi:hypothetical protein
VAADRLHPDDWQRFVTPREINELYRESPLEEIL